jgi:sugar O-acyltransferase (sialic acid O-acetyltransferase NeuD family)
MPKKKLLLIGRPSQHAVEVLETAELLGFEVVSILFEGQKPREGVPALRIEDLTAGDKDLPAVLGTPGPYPGFSGRRPDERWRARLERLVADAEASGISNWISLVHPTAHVSRFVVLGKGVFVAPLASISSDTEIGDFTRIGRSSTVGHDVKIGPFCAVGPGVVIPGHVSLEANVTVGPGAVFLNNIKVGTGSMIAAGSMVTRSVKPGSLALGNPARTGLRPKTAIRKAPKRFARWALKKLGLFDSVKSLLRRHRP